MKCQDCELILAQGQVTSEVEEHLQQCAECRALGQDLLANALVLESLRSEELPSVVVKLPRRGRVYAWVAVAAAAMFAFALLVPRPQPLKPVASPVVSQMASQPAPLPQPPETAKAEPPRLQSRQKVESLKIKMLTPDPNIVIYWLIED
jgi:hypothetical protein